MEGPPQRALPAPTHHKPRSPEKSDASVAAKLVKITLLGLVVAIAIWAAFPLVENHAWIGLAILAATTAGLLYLYLTPRHIPAKYLAPGTLLLVAFQVFLITVAAEAFLADEERLAWATAAVSVVMAGAAAAFLRYLRP